VFAHRNGYLSDVRALFERALTDIPSYRAHNLWNQYLNYETQYGDFASLQKVKNRYVEAYVQGPIKTESALTMADRCRYLDLNHIAEVELGIKGMSI
jgi:cleavage stimulation factor subunit 3